MECETRALRRELEETRTALRLQTVRCRQLVAAYATKLQEKEAEVRAVSELRNEQLGRVLRALLVLEARLRREQRHIRQQLADKDDVIRTQQLEIARLRKVDESTNDLVLAHSASFRYLFVLPFRSLFLSSFLFFLSSSIYLSVRLSIYLSVCLSIYLSICPSIYLSAHLAIYLSIYLSVRLSIYLSVRLSIYLPIYLSICLCIYLSVRLSIHLSVCMSIIFFHSFSSLHIVTIADTM